MKNSRFVVIISIFIPVIYVAFILFFMIMIKYNLSDLESISWCPSLTKEGFNLFAELFKVPLRMLWRGMIVYGIFIAAYNLYQAHKQFNEQFKMHQQNIYINNYYKHQDAFIKYIFTALADLGLPTIKESYSDQFSWEQRVIEIDHNKFKISNYTIIQIFRIWFGHIKNENFELKINENIFKKVKILYSHNQHLIQKDKKNLQQKYVLTDDLNNIIDEIGLSKIKPTGQKWEDASKIKVIFTVCRAILEFDNQLIENEQELYKLINI